MLEWTARLNPVHVIHKEFEAVSRKGDVADAHHPDCGREFFPGTLVAGAFDEILHGMFAVGNPVIGRGAFLQGPIGFERRCFIFF
ncbi:hypothetical protein SDC9_175054 [bioreactor metagenome]|uniref:Uncharacterized protein n=1 Tax=bioreactor metagenome TaxID=1076179 RepID=A0A645GN63_9ZZZZ